jgi:hypothetical protein
MESTETCRHDAVDDGPLDASDDKPGDCQTPGCRSGKLVPLADDKDDTNPATPCIRYSCDAGVPSARNLPSGTICGDAGIQLCDDAGACGCTRNDQCTWPAMCTNGACECSPSVCALRALTCGSYDYACGTAPLSCDDDAGVPNGNETDVNCGGPEPDPTPDPMPDASTCVNRCGLGKHCKKTSDCNTGVCYQDVCCKAACSWGWVCNGSGVCKATSGAACTGSGQCLSGTCIHVNGKGHCQ